MAENPNREEVKGDAKREDAEQIPSVADAISAAKHSAFQAAVLGSGGIMFSTTDRNNY